MHRNKLHLAEYPTELWRVDCHFRHGHHSGEPVKLTLVEETTRGEALLVLWPHDKVCRAKQEHL